MRSDPDHTLQNWPRAGWAAEAKVSASVGATAYLLLVLLFWPNLHAFFIFDDIAGLAMSAPQAGVGWGDILSPQGNGFWRPAYLVAQRPVAYWFGLEPLAFHLTALIPLAVAAALTGRMARRLWPDSPTLEWLAPLMLTTHLASWFAGITWANACDSLLTVFLLGGLLAWDGWLRAGGRLRATLVGGCFLLALTAKETGVIYPVMLTLWLWARAPGQRLGWRMVAVLWGASLLHGLAVIWLQATHDSYATGGFFSASPQNFFRQFTDYYGSLWVPYLHVIDWPLVEVGLPHLFYWGLRLATAGLLAWGGWRFLRTRGERPVLLCLALAGVPLVLPSLLRGAPEGRFLYPALPFAVLALAGGLARLRGGWRLGLGITAGLLWASFIVSFYISADINQRRELGEPLARFTEAIQDEAADWRKGAVIGVIDHPHPGEEPWRWVYAQMHLRLFAPEAEATIRLDEMAGADVVYRFEDPKLVRVR